MIDYQKYKNIFFGDILNQISNNKKTHTKYKEMKEALKWMINAAIINSWNVIQV